jgi:fumarate reductase subunit D
MDEPRVEETSLGAILDESDSREVRRGERPVRSRVHRARRLLHPEPIFWALFSAGGFVAALLVPVHVAILGIAFAAGWLRALVALPLYHWAHRFRFAIYHQFGIVRWKRLVAVGCYGTAIAGTAVSGWVLLHI